LRLFKAEMFTFEISARLILKGGPKNCFTYIDLNSMSITIL
jgi:hypothetical protein